MLRITADKAVDGLVVLQLDGQVAGRWVNLLRRTCDAQLESDAKVSIDLQNVSFADREGIDLLRSLTAVGVEILNALPFIAEQIAKAPPQ